MNTDHLIRWAALPAIGAGLIFALIQPIHPPDTLASVTTEAWLIIQTVKTVMCLLFLLGITGLYARQAKEAGWLGLVGYLLFSLAWALQLPFVFTEAFLLPPLATSEPAVVVSFLSIINESTAEISLGALPSLYTLAGALYMLGSLLFGIAMLRAHVLPRAATLLLALAGPLAILLVSVLPHHLERLGALPMGIAMIWLGYGLWSARQPDHADPAAETGRARLSQSSVS